MAIRRSCVIPSLTNSPVEADPDAEEDEGEEEEDGEDADERDLHVRQERPAKTESFNGPSRRLFAPAAFSMHTNWLALMSGDFAYERHPTERGGIAVFRVMGGFTLSWLWLLFRQILGSSQKLQMKSS